MSLPSVRQYALVFTVRHTRLRLYHPLALVLSLSARLELLTTRISLVYRPRSDRYQGNYKRTSPAKFSHRRGRRPFIFPLDAAAFGTPDEQNLDRPPRALPSQVRGTDQCNTTPYKWRSPS